MFPAKVWKPLDVGAHLTAKAFNTRVLVSWLASCLVMAVGQEVKDGRLVGRWIHESGLEWPEHELLEPSNVAMMLVKEHPVLIFNNVFLL